MATKVNTGLAETKGQPTVEFMLSYSTDCPETRTYYTHIEYWSKPDDGQRVYRRRSKQARYGFPTLRTRQLKQLRRSIENSFR